MEIMIKDLGEIITGNTPSKKNEEFWNSGDICFVKPDIISDNGVNEIFESNEYISERARKKARIVSRDSIFITCIGSIGKIGIALEGEYAFNQQINAIVPNDKVVPKYLAYNLLYNKPRLVSIANAPVVPIINKSQFGDFIINIDSDKNKQSEIADVLDKLTHIIKLRNDELSALEDLIKARFVEMFGECNNYELLGKADIFISDGNYSSKYPTADEFVTEGIPFIRASNMIDNTITDDEMYYISAEKHAELLKGHVKPNDVLIATRGAGIGKIAVVPEKHNDSNINAQIVLLRCNKDIYNPLYLSWYMKLQETQIKIQGLVSGSAQPQLPIKRLIQLTLLKPEIEMQNEFADFVHQVDKSKVAVQKALDETQLLFDSLMQQYFG